MKLETTPAQKELNRLCKQQVGQMGLTEKRLDAFRGKPKTDEFHKTLERYKRHKLVLETYQQVYRSVVYAESQIILPSG